ncbi:MAG: S-layer homology domain-containing protein [Richelia sp.]|nr:S-layer homology domain-containing protein [Richelia sp.]
MLHSRISIVYLFWAVTITPLIACTDSSIGTNLEKSLAPDPNLQENTTVFGAKNLSARQNESTKSRTNLPADFPEDIPPYPNAKLQEVKPAQGRENQVTTQWLSKDPSNIITNFYRQQLKNNKWQIVNEEQPTENFQSVLSAKRSGVEVNISIQPRRVSNTSPNQSQTSRDTEIIIAYIASQKTNTPPKQGNLPQPGKPEFIGPISLKEPTPQAANKSTPANNLSSNIGDKNQAPQQLRQYLQDLAVLGILTEPNNNNKNNSTTDKQFQPNRIITRREYTRWLLAANNAMYANNPAKQIRLASPSERAVFKDLPSQDPDFPTIQGLAEAGLIPSSLSGDSKAVLFRPDRPLTREQLLLWKIPLDIRQGLPNADLNLVKQIWGFQDVGKIAPKALRALLADHQNGEKSNVRRVFGYTTLFQPKKAVTRAEAAASLWYFGTEGEGISAVEAAKLKN